MRRSPTSPWWLLLAASCAQEASCAREFTDEACYGDKMPPWGTVAILALFDQDGARVCTPGRLQARQSGRPWFDLSHDILNVADLFPNGRFGLLPSNMACNVYSGAGAPGALTRQLYPCSDPLEWRVEVPGCEPVSGRTTWNDNTFPGRFGPNFYVTVALRCGNTVDAGTPADAARD